MSTEPAVKTGVLVSGVGVALTLLIAFGLELTKDQLAAIMGAAMFIQANAQGFLTRYQVSPYPRKADIDETPDDAVMH